METNFGKKDYKKGKIPFKSTELREFSTGWVVEFYYTDIETGLLTRSRKKVQRERKAYGNDDIARTHLWKECKRLDKQLAGGWTPLGNLIEKTPEEDKLFYLFDLFLTFKEKTLRPDSLRVLKSSIKRMKDWLSEKEMSDISVYDFDAKMVVKFSDYMLLKLKCSHRGYNNTKAHFRGIWNWMIDERKIEIKNPWTNLKSLKNEKVNIEVIPRAWDDKVLNYCIDYDPVLELVCQLIHGPSFMRIMEICRCKIGCINLKNKTIYLQSEMTKMGNARTVFITDHVIELLLKFNIERMDPKMYLIGKHTGRYAPLKFGSDKMINTRDVDKNWDRLRDKIEMPKKYRIYSWKYRGIGELVIEGYSTDQISQLSGHLSDEIKTYIPDIAKQTVAKELSTHSKGIGEKKRSLKPISKETDKQKDSIK